MIMLMKHPKHGAHHVYSEQEALEHERHGWVRPIPDITAQVMQDTAEHLELPSVKQTLTLKKRGRPAKASHVDHKLQ